MPSSCHAPPQGDLFSLWSVWLRAGSGNPRCRDAPAAAQLPLMQPCDSFLLWATFLITLKALQAVKPHQKRLPQSSLIQMEDQNIKIWKEITLPANQNPHELGAEHSQDRAGGNETRQLLHPVFSSNLILSNLTPYTFWNNNFHFLIKIMIVSWNSFQ